MLGLKPRVKQRQYNIVAIINNHIPLLAIISSNISVLNYKKDKLISKLMSNIEV